jgi:glutathione synthase
MKFLFLMDPLEMVNIHKDTTFVFMLEAHRRKHGVYFLSDTGIYRLNGKTHFDCVQVVPQRNERIPFITKSQKTFTENDVDAVFIRPDPPFDERYLINTWFLDLLPKRVFVMNRPSGVRSVNEKIWGSQFTDLVPSTFIGRNKMQALKFIRSNREVIAKPTNKYGGHGVFYIAQGDTNTQVILEALSENWDQEIILQKYIPAAKQGDKRILLLNGDVLGAVMRVHGKDDHRNNLFAGGSARKTTINKRDLEIVARLKPYLADLGLYFVGIDIIGNYLIEVNVTSPTCLQEMSHFYKKHLEEQVISFVEDMVIQKR